MIELKGLTKTWSDGHVALRGVDLTFGDGMFGLLGPNGAGKTTLISRASSTSCTARGCAESD
jgi:ABC-type multidrug transport system ATPase subunit